MRSLHLQRRLHLILLQLLLTIFTANASIECPIGYGSTEIQVISDDRINDNFCDCPTTGADEPNTNACAGLEYWPGQASAMDNTLPPPILFTCPQQPNLQLSVSKLHDGICDCCDGADEAAGSCENVCESLLAAEREHRAKIKAAFDVGYSKRQKAIAEFEEFKQSVQVQTQEKESELEIIGANLEQAKEKVQDWKANYASSRLAQVESVVMAITSAQSKGALGFMEALTEDELIGLIIHACQLAGEMEGADDTKTCGPLRLAGLDAGLQWESNTYELKFLRNSEGGMKVLADLFYHNLKLDKKTWTSSNISKKTPHGRRLTRQDEDDDAAFNDDVLLGDDDEDLADRMHHDMENERRGRQSDEAANPSTMNTNEDDGGAKREELIRDLRQTVFSRSRVSFLDQASSMLGLIEEAKKKNEETKVNDEVEAGDETDPTEVTEEHSASESSPDTVPMVKSRLEQLTKRVTRGIDYAISAKVLLGAVNSHKFDDAQTRKKYLHALAAGTLNHGHLSSLHLWHILRAAVAELSDTSIAEDAETCASPWSSACPPKVIDRKVGARTIKLPSGIILKAAQDFCKQQLNADLTQVCAAKESIPAEIADGYFGYFAVEPRNDADGLSAALASLSLSLDEASKNELATLETIVESVESEKKAADDSIRDLQASVGGDDPNKFGPDGELHSIKDSCFSITTGKYTYELCMFGQAKQKDENSGGTDLGTWSEATVDEEAGQRVWKWERGAKCWNGPQRSALAYVTCGKDTKVLSADEPETCLYVLQVESYVACDDAFRLRHQLE
jgi:hypothetical protein